MYHTISTICSISKTLRIPKGRHISITSISTTDTHWSCNNDAISSWKYWAHSWWNSASCSFCWSAKTGCSPYTSGKCWRNIESEKVGRRIILQISSSSQTRSTASLKTKWHDWPNNRGLKTSSWSWNIETRKSRKNRNSFSSMESISYRCTEKRWIVPSSKGRPVHRSSNTAPSSKTTSKPFHNIIYSL